MIDNLIDVLRVFCLCFCGPVILIECIISTVFYSRIVNDCNKIIPDNFTNVLIYVLLIGGVISIAVSVFCCYSSYKFGKTLKEVWPQIRNPQAPPPQNEIVNIVEEP